MRMTNKIMRNNSLYNINQNKMLEDKLTNQMTTQSKIARPSDDPVVAIRALRLRSNVTYVTQYYEKNAADAEHWLSVTADAIKTIDEILKNLYENAGSAANKDLTSDDLQILLTQMKSLTEEFYASGNVDYAGRYIFSGYRTDTAITFSSEDIREMQEHPTSYKIKEQLGYSDIDSFYYTDFSALDDANDLGGNGLNGDQSYEQDITNTKLYRLRLAYDDLDGSGNYPTPEISFKNALLGTDLSTGGDIKDDQGNVTGTTQAMQEFSSAEDAYKAIASGNFDGIAYIPSTGELVFSEKYYQDNFSKGNSFEVTYEKSNWQEGDINPVHYFECTETKDLGNGKTKTTIYNNGATTQPQDIYYDVGFNQKIQVNTLASEVFTHNVQRDMDDFQRCLTQLKGIETQLNDIEKKMAEYPEDSDEYKNLAKKKEAAEKAQSYIRENIHNQFENQITKYQEYMDANNVAGTNNATRGSRLELISTRLMNQQATFKDLQTDNESIDVTQAAVELSSAELIYQAALMATGKIMQTNLMNYI